MDLVRIAGDPEPDGLEIAWIDGAGGVRMRAAFCPCAAARGTAIIAPGRSEFIEKYFETARDLVARGFCVLIVDQRGQGLSDRLLPDPAAGHMDSFETAIDQFAAAVAAFAEGLPRPWITIAHSMGGAIALRALIDGAVKADAALFTAPMWGVPMPGWAEPLLRGLAALGLEAMVAPGRPARVVPEAFDGNPVTHDSRRHARTNAYLAAAPRIGLAGPTVGWVLDALRLTRSLDEAAARALPIPVRVAIAAEEALVDNARMHALAAAFPQGAAQVFEGARHELLMERDAVRAGVLALFDALADAAAPPPAARRPSRPRAKPRQDVAQQPPVADGDDPPA